ncbi:DUF4190 domain-containing protein [Streptomyces sp. SP17BM10]|uniref:DUF4190 domain-containing protein n=1 Tax=Streptomyces sp. SP17BM10 TaxID=3002530 RepID=UPI002E7932EC|nr:DUF4190 domain-containing protein [Streptomyces sp. SP17BM10]MEE1787830.1 DUF4190 domain-containing protein [Streptomyces sp. SP17BM10]
MSTVMNPTASAAVSSHANTAANAAANAAASSDADRRSATTGRGAVAEADNLAVASFLLGLPGLLIFNIVLGPLAIVLGTLALVRGTRRRGRAVLGVVLGIAALAVFTATTVFAHGVIMEFGS